MSCHSWRSSAAALSDWPNFFPWGRPRWLHTDPTHCSQNQWQTQHCRLSSGGQTPCFPGEKKAGVWHLCYENWFCVWDCVWLCVQVPHVALKIQGKHTIIGWAHVDELHFFLGGQQEHKIMVWKHLCVNNSLPFLLPNGDVNPAPCPAITKLIIWNPKIILCMHTQSRFQIVI